MTVFLALAGLRSDNKRSAGTRSQPRNGAVQTGFGGCPQQADCVCVATDALLAGTLKDGKLLRLTRVCGGVAPRGKLY